MAYVVELTYERTRPPPTTPGRSRRSGGELAGDRRRDKRGVGKGYHTDQRVALLAVFKAAMDIAETVIAPGSLDAFKVARHRHYKSFVLQECMVGTNVCVEMLDEVTRCEIDAERMAEDDELRNLARMSMAAPRMLCAELLALADGSVPLPNEIPSVGGWRRAVGWFRKK